MLVGFITELVVNVLGWVEPKSRMGWIAFWVLAAVAIALLAFIFWSHE